MPSRPPSSAGAKPLPLTVAQCTTTGRSASKADFSARRSARTSWPSIDAEVGPVELLPEQARRGEGLDRLLELRAEALERGADARGQLGELLLDALAGLPQARLEPDAVEVAGERADVGRDRHPVVVEEDDQRRAEAAGLVDRLEGDAAGHRAVADHGDHAAVLAVAAAHGLLDADAVADRRRGVARAHDVVLGLVDRAERGEAAVLADGAELVAAAGEDLVRVGLVADVPEDLVPRRVEQRVQGDRDLAGAEVGAEVAADLPHRVDQELADLLGDLRELRPRSARCRSCGRSIVSRSRLTRCGWR